jgi:hypothetical protein
MGSEYDPVPALRRETKKGVAFRKRFLLENIETGSRQPSRFN